MTKTVLALAASLLPSRVEANHQCHSASIPATSTNWSQSIALPKFDPNVGVLTGIYFWLDTTATGSAQFESLDTTSSAVTMSFQSTVTLARPDNSAIVVAVPVTFLADSPGAYDGTTDYGGASGATHSGLNVFQSANLASPPASDLVLFTGPAGNPGMIALLVSAVDTSTGSGATNLVLQFTQQATANVSICYSWEPDCNHNGVPDGQDIASGTSTDVNANSQPDDCGPAVISYCPGDGSINGGPECPCANSMAGNRGGCLNSTGLGAVLAVAGSASVSNDTLVLSANQLPPSVPGFFMQGTSPDPASGGTGTPFGAGLLCIGGSVIRMAQIGSAPQVGTVDLPFSGDPPLSQQFNIPAGAARYYQVWYRNPGGPCGSPFNTTNAIRVIWGN